MEKNTTQGSGLLRTAFFSGLTLLLVFGGVLVAIYSTVGTGMFRVREEIGFHRLLQDYDFRYGQILAAGQITISHQLDSLGRDLDHMETRIEGVENWLSVLKRRRRLAAHAGPVPGIGPRHAQIYRDASRRALRAFPFSEPIAAVAVAAAVHGVAITGEREEELRQILPRLSSTGFVPMRLSLHVLLGDFHSPERAAENLLEDHGLSLDFAISAMGRDVEAILTSLVILRILEGETWEALSAIQTALGRGRASDDFIRFAAEFFYDFGNPIRSAELFHMLPGEDALSRQADALWIAGYTEHARHIWALLTAPRTEFQAVHDDTLESRALYNFATTAPRDETEALLERLVRQGRPGERYRELGLIRLSRLRSAPAAVTLLEAERGPADSEGYLPISALVDLEILRRRAETMESARIIADAWMLLRRYYEAEGLFRWAAWYFALQRNFAETAMLLRDAERQGFYGSWKDTHMALQLIREGRFDAAIDIKEPLENTDWVAAANLGRIFEARNATARALEHYEKALTLVMETGSVDGSGNEVASVLQYRIARCLRTMGRLEESRRALRLALEHNPDNLNARIELGRM